ncbi:UDP-N-acetylglucosamine--N-acetylmuramyl-(pentapeptide) pyrophosphoryl-undecaprenol N-acetylglucosamine transferase [Gulosibacter molinativorax]|uniref:UDP-N-acetylglucosamine--N-acetylmuramyl-(pentapeptide) pyrophosphoryl-undecaprenol N-acetylglucosamine transferase n=1 Tax=Gulosibacter molinativorax TaxID=256821 RepID=A0ABT7C5D1_9MICO|nr:UDP-N-acetylglucosamine--N-acetylmuramyl-(pentapeptide) pyrophosphoryl-undecaprenol N-acetylglucosamine transferase [Gulosibacter molinativorax]MDJ1370398.1 UDP-N-acetylglucosamine--N-acetylmuramyl-(pentapeptide) pyrophosphoryl-undecaprenol N-acetylglucosamine transferase [Gulosibacter molinativorax]QUY61311.1 UDP-N-acetylglucosamine--N-acetylmuramyl-(Pentapeptide) pyrophosphoryl-undecaprenol N-acetylglucosamine transferase [Gulosibacter molinativorax]
MTTYLLAGGGTAGHVNPLLATADAIVAAHPGAEVIVLGTSEGLETRLVPQRGYELVTIEKVPFPRRPNGAALRFPAKFRRAVKRVRRLIAERGVDVVVGFGGFASTPAYVAARGRVPVVVHEANSMPGLANKLGARWAAASAIVFPNTPLRGGQLIGMPLRREIAQLDRSAARPEAIEYFGLDANRKTLVVTGGSQGAKRINETIRELAPRIVGQSHGANEWQILHIVGRLSPFEDPQIPHYHVIEYCDRMELALAVADLIVSRAGASTVSELAALGLPALYVPYAVGNGEQAKNIASLLDANAALTVKDGEFTPDNAAAQVFPLLADDEAREALGERAAKPGIRDAAERMVTLIDGTLR